MTEVKKAAMIATEGSVWPEGATRGADARDAAAGEGGTTTGRVTARPGADTLTLITTEVLIGERVEVGGWGRRRGRG